MEDALPRHSLTHLSACLKQRGHEVLLVDLRLLDGWSDFDDLLARRAPDVVAVTAHTVEAEVAAECCDRAKLVLPSCVTVGGGIHFTMVADQAPPSLDFVIRGEGEIALPQLVEDRGAPARVTWGEPPDLDGLPFEDRELWPDYSWRTRFPVWDLAPPTVDVLTGRGCPFACRFCCGPGEQNLFTVPSPLRPSRRIPSFRRRSVDHVLAELGSLRHRYGFRSVVFHDDQFLLDPAWTSELCAGLHDQGHVRRGVRWWAACRADIVCRHPDVVAEMARAGLKILSIGFESFSDPLLRWLGKRCTAAENHEAAAICRQLGIDVFANAMLGVPREDGRWRIEDDLATVEALETLQPRWVSPSVFTPVPGSALFDWCQQRDLIGDTSVMRVGSRTPAPPAVRGVDADALAPLIARLQRLGRHPWVDRVQRLRFRLAPGRPRRGGLHGR